MPDSDYNYIDLFHGIGGFALGAYWAGMKFKNHFCSDIEPYCQKLYKLRFPDSIQLGDVKKIDYEDLIKRYGNRWIITGGFPCQPHSQAGKRGGSADERDLSDEVIRAVRILRPTVGIFENVSGLLTSDGGLFFNGFLKRLAEIGYNVEWQDIRAEDVGAPHKREREWIVAYADGERHIFGQNEIKSTDRREFAQYNACSESEMADTSESGLSQPQKEKQQKFILYVERGSTKISNTNESRLSSSSWKQFKGIQRENESFQGSKFGGRFTKKKSRNWWSAEPDVGRLAHGIPSRVDRLKGLGNAIVPQIAELLFRQIKDLL